MNETPGRSAAVSGSLVTVGAITLGSRMLVLIMSALLGVITARLLGPAQRGIYVLPCIYAGLVIAGLSALGTTTSFFMLNAGVGRAALRPAAITASAFILAGSGMIALLAFSARQPWAIAPAVLALFPAAIVHIASGYFFGTSRVLSNTILWSSWTATTFLLMLIGLLSLGRTASIAITMWLASMVCVAVVAVAVVWRADSSGSDIALSVRRFSAYAVKTAVINLISVLNYRIDVYFIAAFTKPGDLATYTIAVAAAEAVGVVTQVLPQITLPRIGSASMTESAELTARYARINIALAAIVCGLLFVLAPWAVTLIYGEAFAPAVAPLRVLLIGSLSIAPGSLISTYFMIKLGRPHLVLVIVSGSVIVAAIVCITLIPRFGILGGAIATAVSYAVSGIIELVAFAWLSRLPLSSALFIRGGDLAPFIERLRRLRGRCTF